MSKLTLMCWAIAGTLVGATGLVAFAQQGTPSRPTRPLPATDNGDQQRPRRVDGGSSRPNQPVQSPVTDNRPALGTTDSSNTQQDTTPSIVARKSGAWTDEAVWGIRDQGPRPYAWPLNRPWPLDPREQELRVFSGGYTVGLQGDARAKSFTGNLSGSGRLTLSESFQGRVTGASVNTRAISGSVELIGGTINTGGGQLVLDAMRTSWGRELHKAVGGTGFPVMELTGCGRVIGSVEIGPGGCLRVEQPPDTLPPTPDRRLSISGDLRMSPSGFVHIDAHESIFGHRLVIPSVFQNAPLVVSGQLHAGGTVSRLRIDSPTPGAPGSSFTAAVFSSGVSGALPFTTVCPRSSSVQIDNAPNHLVSRLSQLGRSPGNKQADNQALAELNRAMFHSTDEVDRVLARQPKTWWATAFTPRHATHRPSQFSLEVFNPVQLEAISVRLPEYASGGSMSLDALSKYDNIVLVTHGTRSSCNRSPTPVINDDLITMGQIASRFRVLAEVVNAGHDVAPGEAPIRSVKQIIQDHCDRLYNSVLTHTPYPIDPCWGVTALDWREWATGNNGPDPEGTLTWLFNPWISAFYAQQIGRSLADEIAARREVTRQGPMKRLHLLGHSSGSWLVDAIADRLREHWGPPELGGPEITLTFFDAFDQGGAQAIFGAQGQLGDSADMVEHYYEAAMPFTQARGAGLQSYATNVDVSALRNPTDAEHSHKEQNEWLDRAGMPSLPPSLLLWGDKHSWPYEWYLRTMQAFVTDGSPGKPCEGDPDCKWQQWGVIRSPLAQDLLAMQRKTGQVTK
jgi:hypothetical protein